MKTIDILNKQLTVLPNINGYVNKQGVTVYTQVNKSLKWILDLGQQYKIPINKLREMDYHSDEQKTYKMGFPCWFVGGTFPMKNTNDNNILEYSNLIAIDIDKKDNPEIDIEDIKKKLFALPYVILVSKSISGKGIYVLILVEDGKFTKEYYRYISKLWSKQYGLNIDEQCKNIGRKRFISYDDDLMIKGDDVEIKEWKLKLNNEITKKQEIKQITHYSKYATETDNKKLTHDAICYLLNNGYSIDDFNCTSEHYGLWYHIGCDFRHFNDGEDMFIKFSTNSSKYNDSIQDIMNKWNNTKIESDLSEVSRKWCGICKRKLGKYWIKIISENFIIK